MVPGQTRLRAREDIGLAVEAGDTGVYAGGADYIPGWDAGQYSVTLDQPRTRQISQPHWTLDELLRYWEVI